MLSLARSPLHKNCVCRAHPCPAPRRAMIDMRHAVHAAVPAPAAEEVGPVCKQMLGLLDADCNTVQKLLLPAPVRASLIQATQNLVQECARSAFDNDNVQVKLVGSAGAGTHLPDTSPIFFVQLSHYDSSKQESYVESINHELQQQHHLEITKPSDDDCIIEPYVTWPSWFKSKGSTLLCKLLIGSAVSGQHLVKAQEVWADDSTREDLSEVSVVARTTLLQQQPPLFKLAARVAMHWVQSIMDADCYRFAPHFFEFLVLKAFQQYQESATSIFGCTPSKATAAAQQFSGPADSDDVDWFALDMILLNFLRLSAGLNKDSVIYWDVAATVYMLANPGQAAMLKPEGQPDYPLVLDPVNPHYNAATDLVTEELEVFLQRVQELYRTAEVHACEATIAVLLQCRAVQDITGPADSLNQQIPDLLSKLNSQARLLQQLVTMLAEHNAQRAVAAAGKYYQQPGDTSSEENPESSES